MIRTITVMISAVLLSVSLTFAASWVPASAQEEDEPTPTLDQPDGVPVEPELRPFEAVLELVDYQFDMQFLEGTRLEGPDRDKEGPCNFVVPLDAAQRESLAQTGTTKATVPAMCSGVWLQYFDEVNTINRGQERDAQDNTLERAVKEFSLPLNLEGSSYRSQSLKLILTQDPLAGDAAGATLPATGVPGDEDSTTEWVLKAGIALAITCGLTLVLWRRRAV